MPCFCRLSGPRLPNKFLTSIKLQHADFQLEAARCVGRPTAERHSVGQNPSRACLVLPGALRIYLAQYFAIPYARILIEHPP